MMDEEIRQALSEVQEMKKMCGNINMKLTNIVTQRGQDWKAKLEAEYHRGLEDGKAVHERGCEGCQYEDCTSGQEPCFRCARNANDYWTAKQTDDEIKVGDEVVIHGEDAKTDGTGVITWIGEKSGYCNVMWGDGSIGDWAMSELAKTGRHFDISSILKEMQS